MFQSSLICNLLSQDYKFFPSLSRRYYETCERKTGHTITQTASIDQAPETEIRLARKLHQRGISSNVSKLTTLDFVVNAQNPKSIPLHRRKLREPLARAAIPWKATRKIFNESVARFRAVYSRRCLTSDVCPRLEDVPRVRKRPSIKAGDARPVEICKHGGSADI